MSSPKFLTLVKIKSDFHNHIIRKCFSLFIFEIFLCRHTTIRPTSVTSGSITRFTSTMLITPLGLILRKMELFFFFPNEEKSEEVEPCQGVRTESTGTNMRNFEYLIKTTFYRRLNPNGLWRKIKKSLHQKKDILRSIKEYQSKSNMW